MIEELSEAVTIITLWMWLANFGAEVIWIEERVS